MKQYVIIGNGVAAAATIEGIRSRDSQGLITVVSKEKYPVYCRPLISYLLEGKTDLTRMQYRDPDFYKNNKAEVLYGVSAAKLSAGKVELDNGSSLPFDECIVATGSDPFVPPFKGLDTVEDKYTFQTLDDALAIEKAIRGDSRVFIVGAGLIGLKCAEGLTGRVGSITVCDLADRVLSSILDAPTAAIVQKHLEKNGMSFLLADSASEFKKNADGAYTALMSSGKSVDFDILVLAVGVRAGTRLVKEAGGKVERGIVIDEACRTSLDHVYAAGDCAQTMELTQGTSKVMAILPNAYLEGYTAGVNAASEDAGSPAAVFDNAIAMNSIGFMGLHIMSAGSAPEGCQVYEERDQDHWKKLFTKDGYLTGFMLVGDIDRAGIYTNMIRNRIPLSEVDFESMKKLPNLYAFGEKYRHHILTGEV